MINKPVFELQEQDLQDLINKKISESIRLEYKQSIDISSKSARKELCKDVSAMANAFGGKIIYGLAESKQKDVGSIPSKLTPIKDHSLKESMQQIITDGILPRIDFQINNFESDKYPGHEYVVIDVPQSIRGPHFVCTGKENRFYKRRDFEAKPMDQKEIENAYRNFFFQEMKINNLYNQIKKENPNKRLGLPSCSYCSIYFIPQYPVECLFYRKFNHSTLNERVIKIYNDGYLQVYNNVFKNSFDGLTNIRKAEKLTERQDIYYRNGCILYSFSLYNSLLGNKYLISLDDFAYSLLNILEVIPLLYKECGYLGNLQIITNLECIDNYTLHLQGIFNSSDSITGGKFESKLQTSIDKLIANPKQESLPLLRHLMQSFGVNDNHINRFIKTF